MSISDARSTADIRSYIGGDSSVYSDQDIKVHSFYNVTTGGATLDNLVKATGNASGGSLVGAGNGVEVDAVSSPTVRATVETGADLSAGAAVEVVSNVNSKARGDGDSVTVGGVGGVGVVLSDVTVAGSVRTNFNGNLTSADSLLVKTVIDTDVDSDGNANGGSLGVSGNGTEVESTISTAVDTYIGGNARINTTNDVVLDARVTSNADSTSGAVTFSGGAAVGSTPAYATIETDVETTVRSGAIVTSDEGNVSLQGGHNYNFETSEFIVDNKAKVSTEVLTVSLGVSVAPTTITARSRADVSTIIDSDATVRAVSGNVSVLSRAGNFSDAKVINDGGAAVSVQTSTPTAESKGSSSATIVGNITDGLGGNGAASVSSTCLRSSDRFGADLPDS